MYFYINDSLDSPYINKLLPINFTTHKNYIVSFIKCPNLKLLIYHYLIDKNIISNDNIPIK
nr:MAG TPA: hypothetical protein [Caudoviricetes sp.]